MNNKMSLVKKRRSYNQQNERQNFTGDERRTAFIHCNIRVSISVPMK